MKSPLKVEYDGEDSRNLLRIPDSLCTRRRTKVISSVCTSSFQDGIGDIEGHLLQVGLAGESGADVKHAFRKAKDRFHCRAINIC